MNNDPKDYLGHDIKVGDHVVFIHVKYAQFVVGTITKIGKKQATIEYISEYDHQTYEPTEYEKTHRFFNQIISIER